MSEIIVFPLARPAARRGTQGGAQGGLHAAPHGNDAVASLADRLSKIELSDIGALAILSAFKDAQQIPSPELYSRLCREYGKSLGVIVLKKWAVDDSYIAVVRGLGAWDGSSGPGVELVDLINLGLFHALREAGPTALLPPLRELAAYRKLQPPLNALDPSGNGLALVASQRAEIQRVESLLQ